jgi:ABC-type nitrate/sulfonate/bicarbonate transport system permease component
MLAFWRRNYLSTIGLVGLMALWITVTGLKLVPELYLPSPMAIVNSFIDNFDEIPMAVSSTLFRVLVGFVVGGSLGVITGMLIAWSYTVGKLLEPLVEFIRPMPPLALLPLFILWFGIGNDSKILLIGLGAWVIMVVDTIEAVRKVNPLFINAARTLGAGNMRIFGTVLIPSIVPVIMGGARVALAASFGMAVAAEFMGTRWGLGAIIIKGQQFIMTDLLFVGILLITFAAILSDWGLRVVEKRMTRWVPKMTDF